MDGSYTCARPTRRRCALAFLTLPHTTHRKKNSTLPRNPFPRRIQIRLPSPTTKTLSINHDMRHAVSVKSISVNPYPCAWVAHHGISLSGFLSSFLSYRAFFVFLVFSHSSLSFSRHRLLLLSLKVPPPPLPRTRDLPIFSNPTITAPELDPSPVMLTHHSPIFRFDGLKY